MSQSNPPPAAPPGALNLRASDLLLLLIVVLGLSRLLGGLAGDLISPFAPSPIEDMTGEEDPSSGMGSGMGFAFTLMILQLAITLGACYLIILRPYDLRLADLGLGRLEARHVRLGVVSGILALPLVTLVNHLLQSVQGAPFDNPQIDILMSGGLEPSALIGFLILGGVVAPFVEEIAFRGILFGWLRGRMHILLAIFSCGLVFAMMHGFPQLIPALTAIGILLTYLRLISDSLWPPIIAHAVFNVASMLLVYAAIAQQFSQNAGG